MLKIKCCFRNVIEKSDKKVKLWIILVLVVFMVYVNFIDMFVKCREKI